MKRFCQRFPLSLQNKSSFMFNMLQLSLKVLVINKKTKVDENSHENHRIAIVP